MVRSIVDDGYLPPSLGRPQYILCDHLLFFFFFRILFKKSQLQGMIIDKNNLERMITMNFRRIKCRCQKNPQRAIITQKVQAEQHCVKSRDILNGAKLGVAPVARAPPLFLPRPELKYIYVLHTSAPPRTYLVRATLLLSPDWQWNIQNIENREVYV